MTEAPTVSSSRADRDDLSAVLDSTQAGSKIVRGGVVRAAGYAVTTLLSLIGIKLLTAHLGVTQFGRYQTVISLIAVVAAASDAGMTTLGVREFAQLEGSERDGFMRRLLGLRITLTLVGVAVAVVVAIALGYDSALLAGTVLAGAGLILTVVQGTLSIPLGAGLRNGALAGLDMVRQAFTVAAFAILIATGSSVALLLGVPIGAGVILIALTVLLVRRGVPLTPSFTPRAWGVMLRAAVAFALATAVGAIYLYVTQILTSVVTTGHQAGLFAASFRVFITTAQIPGILVGVAFPLLARAARDDRERLGYALQRLFDVTSVLGIGAAVGLVLGAPFIISVMAGGDFAGAATPLRIQGIAMLASFLFATWGYALLSLHQHNRILQANLTALAVNLVGVLTLARFFGAAGAASGAALGETVLAASYYRALISPEVNLRPSWANALRAAGCAAPALAILLIGLPSWAALLLGFGLYVALLVPAGAVPDEVMDAFRRRVGSAPD